MRNQHPLLFIWISLLGLLCIVLASCGVVNTFPTPPIQGTNCGVISKNG